MSQEILDDAKICTLEVTCGTWFNGKRIRNIADGTDVVDGVNVGQLSTNLGPIIEDVSTLMGAGPGLVGTWAYFPALSNVNVASNNIISTVNQTYINGSNSINVNYETISSFAYVSTSFSTLAQYVAIDSCLLVQTSSNLSGLSTYVSSLGGIFENVSSSLSTLTYYTAVDACITVTNKNNISTMEANLPARRRIGFSTMDLATATPAQIIGTNVSTLGWVTTFRAPSFALTMNLDLSNLNIWPKQQFDCMRFGHVGQSSDSVVHVYANDAIDPESYLGSLSPGTSYSYVYNGPLPPTQEAIILSTNYIRLSGV